MKAMQVVLSVGVTALGILMGFMWGPGAASLDLKTTSVGCMLGGFALWFWILQATLEGQSVCPYKGRPSPQATDEASQMNSVWEWYTGTQLINCHQREWLLKNGVVYAMAFVLFLVSLSLSESDLLTQALYVIAICFYFYEGLWVPSQFMGGNDA